ncbi:MAG TPA: hypothetical protein ENF52_02705, partial [Chloroflexi bacterium]|nr:hypothetical protein [Chloroflexota bacterium]
MRKTHQWFKWNLHLMTLVALVILLSWIIVIQVTQHGLQVSLASTYPFDLRSKRVADYSADPRERHFAPLDPKLIAQVIAEESLYREEISDVPLTITAIWNTPVGLDPTSTPPSGGTSATAPTATRPAPPANPTSKPPHLPSRTPEATPTPRPSATPTATQIESESAGLRDFSAALDDEDNLMLIWQG